MYEVSVAIEKTIEGTIADREIIVEAVLAIPAESHPFPLQVLAVEKRFVFFLTPRKDSKIWKGASPFQFALRVEASPALGDQKSRGDQEKGSATDLLRITAKANIKKADELCAAKWFRFLGQQYNTKEDFEFSLKWMDDPRLRIRGEALTILCKHHPKTTGLYGKALKFIEDTALTPECGHLRSRVLDQLLNTLDHLKPKVKNKAFKTLLLKNDKLLNQATLTAIRDKQYSDLLPDVIDFMMRSKDRHLQYGCIKTLYKLKNKNYPAMHIFLEDPEKYINEFK